MRFTTCGQRYTTLWCTTSAHLPLDPAGGSDPDPVIGSRSELAMSPHPTISRRFTPLRARSYDMRPKAANDDYWGLGVFLF